MAEFSLATLKGIQVVGQCKQLNPGLLAEGDKEAALFINRGHALQINSREGMVDAWTRSGRVFIANNPVLGQPETMSANGTALTLTAPSLRFSVPTGAVVVPLHVQISSIQVNAKKAVFAVIATASDSFTSGGDAVPMVPYSAIGWVGGTGGPIVTNLHYSDTAIVEAALSQPRLLKMLKKMGTATDETSWNPEYNVLKGDPMMYMVGPASFLVFDVQETAADEAEWSMSWAVLDTGSVL